jgi:ComEC/Rec2-related protein
MPAIALVLLALLALCLPAGGGFLAPALIVLAPRWRRAAGPAALAGLVLLAGAPLVPRLRPRAVPACDAFPAARVSGTWRAPPAGEGHLDTPRGPLALQLADDVQAPPPGTPVELLLRLSEGRPPLAVSLRSLGPPSGAWLDRWAAGCVDRARHLVSRDNRGLFAALVLGQREDLAWPIRAAYAATGTTHVLAISGMHVALLAAALRALSASGSWRRPALVLLGFVAVAGAGAPLVRSALGWLLLAASARLSRPVDGLQRLAGVALVMECWQPGLHLELSAQLSFLAVAGLIAGARLVRGPAAVLLGPAGAFLATAPLCAEVFGRVQPCGVLVTPLLTPPLALLLVLSLVAVLPLALFAALDPLTAPLLEAALDALRITAEVCARYCPPPLRPPAPPVPGVLLSLLVVAALVVLAERRVLRRAELAIP